MKANLFKLFMRFPLDPLQLSVGELDAEEYLTGNVL